MNWFWKKTEVPDSVATHEVDTIQLWSVDWMSRNGAYSSSTQKESEWFPNEQDALEFANGLKAAFKLLKHSGDGTQVVIQKRK